MENRRELTNVILSGLIFLAMWVLVGYVMITLLQIERKDLYFTAGFFFYPTYQLVDRYMKRK